MRFLFNFILLDMPVQKRWMLSPLSVQDCLMQGRFLRELGLNGTNFFLSMWKVSQIEYKHIKWSESSI